MVSNASDDLPLPLGPVITDNCPSGRSISMPLRLFWRAPRISTQPRSAGAVTHSFECFGGAFEPTGDYSRLGASAQILVGENRRKLAPSMTGSRNDLRNDGHVVECGA